jgi:alanine-synthesizing transaminase
MEQTPWAKELARLRAAGSILWDLTESNPTRCGFAYDADSLLAPLNTPSALTYRPEPRGIRSARESVSSYYRDFGHLVDPEQVFLTTSTSEAYSFLFRLLCDPGNEILIAQPGYPLFDFLGQLDSVRLVPYGLFYDHGWHHDLDGLCRAITAQTRAVVIVHPNNPTGHFTRPEEREAIQALCFEHDLALIVDEVFLDYGMTGHWSKQYSFAGGSHPVPTFVLSGISKVAALPQMKAAWIACFAEREGLERLEIISDTFLSMSAPIQLALPRWLSQRAGIQQQIAQRVENNLASLDAILSKQTLVTRLVVEAGWYAVLRIPVVQDQNDLVLELLHRRGVAVHPGGFYGFSGQGWLVVSLLGGEREFEFGVSALSEHFKAIE